MQLERIGVDDDETIAFLARADLGPSRGVPLDPEPSRSPFVFGNDRAVGQRFEKGVRSAVSAAPRGLARAARALDDDDHSSSVVPRYGNTYLREMMERSYDSHE